MATNHKTLAFLICVVIICSVEVLAKKSPRPISDTEVRQKKQDCYSDIELGYWGKQCKSSMVAKENCALKCLSPACYELIYESDPTGTITNGQKAAIICPTQKGETGTHSQSFACAKDLEEGEKDYVRSQEYKYCMHRLSLGESLDGVRGSFD